VDIKSTLAIFVFASGVVVAPRISLQNRLATHISRLAPPSAGLSPCVKECNFQILIT
jgi:hypothetical protein